MQATVAKDGQELARQARRAGELIQTAVDVLREEVTEEGAMARALERLSRVSRSLAPGAAGPDGLPAAVGATHHALAHTIAIGQAIRDALDARGQQCLETLASAQRILYPVAKECGIETPPPLQASKQAPAEGAQADDRRASPRIDLNIEVSLESESNFYQGFSEDVSDGGLFIATYQLRPIGSVIDLEFTLPTGHIVRTRAEVRWLRQLRSDADGVSPGMGLQYKDLLPEDKRAIIEFVNARSPLFYDDDL